MLTDAQWAVLGPLVAARRPHAKVPPSNPRRTIGAILRRHGNGAEGRSPPAELGARAPREPPQRLPPPPRGTDDRPRRSWWMAARTFIRWSRLGVRERLLALVQRRGQGGVRLGMAFLDGTSVRAHQKAAGAAREGVLELNGRHVRRLSAPPTSLRGIGRSPMAAPVAALAPRPA